ncbi:MAG TPA: branched-chain amino acid ABC transporter permease [Bradyrhizobium sp.]|uniref:branched-chain amino acid ABC transporter permease n=1 Tax=Bradyrhizobium sp. TaxID=376 RepID=UPI002C69B8C8|nr:branched-chain amino acid ABC transporter permease [Bradyrhizobium sp.]HLZ03118.1 branched-chain amino acid ABC transporter permease [Bradyrhizobium sp.]
MSQALDIVQVVASGLMMGLIYALIAVGLSLIFGLMDVVNFAHGEFLMLAMYATFGFVFATGLDPVIAAPLVVAIMFTIGVAVYAGVIRHALRSRANAGMVQIFATFGLALLIQGLVQYYFTPDYRNIGASWLGGRTLSVAGIFLPCPQIYGGLLSIAVFAGLHLLMTRTDFGRALEATREDKGGVALVGIDRNRIFALGWGLGAALVGLAGSVLAIFYYIHPQVGATFALISYVTVALGGFGSIFGALIAGLIVGLTESVTAMILPPALKSVGVYSLYLAVLFIRPTGLFGKL